ncbi:MAG: HAMP domain-containing protein [candidate division Zixibacteria bacterium]|nr:HAMP domain-containing protein [candidate division Zixibacteria bacterium]
MRLPSRLVNANLRTQFIVPISALLIISMLVISGYLIRRQTDEYVLELETRGSTIASMLAINAESGVLFGSTRQLNALLAELNRFKDVRFGIIKNNDSLLSSTGNVSVTDSSPVTRVDDECNLTSCDATQRFMLDSAGDEILLVSVPIYTRKEMVDREHLGMTGDVAATAATTPDSIEQIGSVQIGLSTDDLAAMTHEAQMAVIFLTVFVLLFAVLVIAIVVSAITRPITELVAVTDQISRGDLSQQVDIKRQDEIGHLATTFNSMIVSLRESRDEIEGYNRTLQEKIVERTQQLEEAQTALIQSEKMSAIGQLAAGVAHELNNPLGGILGYAQFTLEKLQKNAPGKTTQKDYESYIRYVTDIEVQARRCKQIVQNLLRFSRSTRTLEFAPPDLNKVLEETVTFLEHQLHMNQIELSLELEPALPLIQGNAGLLQQVFTNLIINAMHASSGGSTITISSRFSPAVGEFGGAVELLVVDQGHGIAQENIKKIFEPFFTTKEIGKGTGLGLSVSYGIIKEHGGEITVNSTVGKGTTFIVVLPVQKPAPDTDKREEGKTIDNHRG